MNKLIESVNGISEVLGATNIWEILGFTVSLVALVSTIFVLVQNHKSIVLSQKAIKQSTDLQMFDKMMAVANKIEDNDYSSTTMEITTLFGIDVLKQINALKDLIGQLEQEERNHDRYMNLLEKEEEYDQQLDCAYENDELFGSQLAEAEAQHQKYKVLYDYEQGREGCIPSYDIDEILEEITVLRKEIEDKQKNLKNHIYHILQEKFQGRETSNFQNKHRIVREDIQPELLVSQWQTCVEMANSTSQRRDSMNNLFTTLNLAMLAAISFIWDIKTVVLSVAGVAVCVVWFLFIRYFRVLNTEKFTIINQMEENLPFQPFMDEWKSICANKKHIEGTKLERALPIAFVIIYVVVLMVIILTHFGIIGGTQ